MAGKTVEVKPVADANPVKPINQGARDALRENYDKSQGITPEPEPKPGADGKGTPTTDFVPNPPSGAGPKNGATDTPPEAGVTEGGTDIPPKEPKKDDVTMVPHAALHEERERRKETEARLKEVEEQNRILLTDVKELIAKSKQPDKPQEGETELSDPEVRIAALEKANKELQERLDKRDNSEKEIAQKAMVAKYESDLQSTGEVLEKEGFKGFTQFHPLVLAELRKIAATDLKKAQSLDNPQGWAKLYREVVFPTIATVVGGKLADDKLKAKDEKKGDAGLLDGGGSKPADDSKKDEDKWDFDSYMKWRNGGRI